MKSILRTLIPVTIVALGLPGAAGAHGYRTIAPPGDSAVSQYVEVVPTDAGGSPAGFGAPQTGALTPAVRRTLAGAGQPGQTLAAIVEATAPPPARRGTGKSGQTGASAGIPGGSIAGLSAKGAPSSEALVASAVTGGGNGGLGVFLPGIMLAGVVAVIARLVFRRRADP
jgi:hypothetical protein